MKKAITAILLGSILCSCRSGMGIRRSKVKYFGTSFSATVYNKAFKVNGRIWGDQPLLGLLEIPDVAADSLSIRFDDSGKLLVFFKDRDILVKRTIKGDFSKKGYYEIFLHNESREIPPVIHFIYGRHNINRIRMALSKHGDLIIDNAWNQSGNILFLGAGDRGRRQSFFASTDKVVAN